MKIAILSSFFPLRGGIAQFNAALYTELGKEHDVKAFNFSRQYPGILFPGKTQYVSEKDDTAKVTAEPVLDTANPFSYGKAARTIRKWDPDLLLMKYWMPWFAPSLGYVARHMSPRCKVIPILDNVTAHEKRFFDTALTKYFLGGCDGFVTMSGEVTSDLLALKPDARYLLRPHPLYSHFGEPLAREEACSRLGLRPELKTLLFFGFIRAYKGLDILLKAFDMLDDTYQLVIAGEPYGSFDSYGDMIGSSPAKDRIHVFTDYIPDSSVKVYFSAADLTVLPYRSASQSGISSVSFNFEVPSVVTPAGGLPASIGDTGTGLVTRDVSPEAVAETITTYFSSGTIREQCKENIRREKDRLSWRAFCKALADFAQTL